MSPCFPRQYVRLGLFAIALSVAMGLCIACANAAPPPTATPIPIPTATPPPATDPEFAVTPVGLILNESESSPGYTLFNLNKGNRVYLIDNEGRLVHTWDLEGEAALAKLAANGDLLVGLRGRGHSGVRIIALDGTVKWSYRLRSWHHDFLLMPNGNVLMLARERKTAQEAVAAGIDPVCVPEIGVDFDYIVEVRPTGPAAGEVVWRWSVWDHLIQDFDPSQANYGAVAERPELIDVNFRQCEKLERENRRHDWSHINSISYHPERDQILILARNLGEVWIIDHSTTIAEAAGHAGGRAGMGGDLLYRWGNPRAYRAGTPADQRLFWAHDAQWIASGLPGAGNILIFNNGDEYDEARRYYSSIEEFSPPVDGLNYRREPGAAYGPAEPVWRYIAEPPGSFYAQFISGVQRLPNGNTLICSGVTGAFFEVTPEGETVWKYISPVVAGNTPLRQGAPMPIREINRGVQNWANWVYRVARYTPDYPGLRALDLRPGDPIELYE